MRNDSMTKEVLYLQKRIIAAVLAALTAASAAACLTGCGDKSGDQKTQPSANAAAEKKQPLSVDFKTADKVADGAILQAFSWDFNTIKASMADIAAAGFSAVQTSPVNECFKGEGGGMELYGDGKWYYHYQPTDFTIGNYQLGTRDEFKAMCSEAHKYGVKVLVDVIANHTTTTLSAISPNLIKAGGGSLKTLYHKGNDREISDYDNRLQCTTYKMGGLPDVNTERPSYQDYFIKFLNDCIACGADGFRHDTAKHIGLPDDPKEDDGFKNNFWERVTKETDNADKLFVYGEVLQGGNDRLSDYIKEIGRTTASVYGSKIRSAVTNGIIDTANIKEYWVDSDNLSVVTWVESHDNYINDGNCMLMTDDQVISAWAIIAARKDGTPLFFSRPYGSSESSEWGMNRIGAQGSDMYKDSRVSAVNFFRTAMKGEDETLVNPHDSSTALMIERGKKGAVIVNIDKAALKTGFSVNLPDGDYTDRVDGSTVYTVKDGKLTGNDIKPGSVTVLYNDGYTAYAPCANTGVKKGTQFVTTGDSIEVTLTLENAAKAQYTLDGGKPQSFKNGDRVTVKRPKEGEVAKLEMTAENAQGVKTYERAEFTFRDDYRRKKGDTLYFKKPADWGGKVCAYIYNADDEENDTWPGVAMKNEGDGVYSYTFDDDFQSPLVIFNDGKEENGLQYPEAGAKGLKAENDKTYQKTS